MSDNTEVAKFALELRRGTLIMLVLSRLKKPMYGYSLVKQLEDGGVPIEANTLYPLMRRLETNGLLSSEWETSGTKPRKYYCITPKGLALLEQYQHYWQEFSAKVNHLLEADLNDT